MKTLKSAIASVFLVSAFGLAYSQTQVPHTFQSGQPARAAEVNENFSALATDIGAVAATARRFKFIGFSNGVIAPDQGIYAMGDLCRADYGPNARPAKAHEAFDLTELPLGSSQGGAWIDILQEGSFTRSGANCWAWSTINPNTNIPNTATIDDQGKINISVPCDGFRPVACSVLQ